MALVAAEVEKAVREARAEAEATREVECLVVVDWEAMEAMEAPENWAAGWGLFEVVLLRELTRQG